MVASCARPSSFTSGSDSVTLAKARPSVMDRFSGVRGASVRLLGLFLPVSSDEVLTAEVAAFFSVPTVAGRLRTISATFCAWLPSTPRSISVMSSLKVRGRLLGTASMARGSGDTSRMALASATAAWPSTAAWCSCVYSATRFWPWNDGARPSKTWNFHSGFLRSSSTGCRRDTAASSSGRPAFLGSLISTMCCLRSGSASTQAGLARFSGIHHSLRRSTGATGRRLAMCSRSAVMNLPL